MRSRLRRSSTASFLFLLLLPTVALAADEAVPLEGWLTILWGDSVDAGLDDDAPAPRRLVLTDEDGDSVSLSMSDELLHGGVFRWNGRRVAVYPAPGEPFTADGALRVGAIRLMGGAEIAGGVAGSQPWISILCKFADVGAEPENLAYFLGMYANLPGGLDHYWREVSYDTVDVVGSTAVDWVTLPGDHTDYAPTPGSGSNADLNRVFDDCTAAVDAMVDFSPFVGINIMVNDVLDCCAWGGGRFATLDGVTKSWRTTWNPPWAFRQEGVIAHEMGHGFGLPHANNFDSDGDPYDSPWDVMSAATGYATTDPTYGALGKHVNAYHKDALGWFPAARRFTAPPDSSTSLELDHTALAGATQAQIAVIPIDSNRWYTVEARLRSGAYEANLAGDAVIIHQVDLGRSEPAWAVDGEVPPANYGDNPGTMWLPGETFNDPQNSIAVSVDFATATGFAVTVSRGQFDLLFADGFEGGDTGAWASTVP